MLVFGGILRVDEIVIQVDKDEDIKIIMEDIIQQGLEDWKGTAQAKRHHQIFDVAYRSLEGHFLLPISPTETY